MTPAQVHSFHRHENPRLIVFFGKPYCERTLTREARLSPGDFIIRPAFHAHDGEGKAGAHYTSLPVRTSRLNRLFETLGPEPRRGRLPGDWPTRRRDILALGDEILDTLPTRPYHVRDPVTPLDRAAARLARPDAPQPAQLAEDMGLTPWAFSRRFRARFGLSPTEFRCEARLQSAISRIGREGESLSGIAVETGYFDQSHFCRELSRRTGRKASEIRRLLAAD